MLRRWIAREVCETQEELNRAYEPPELDVYAMWTSFFISAAVQYVFVAGLPWVVVIAWIKFFFMYVVEKYNVYRRYRAPSARDDRLASFMANGVLAMMFLTILFACCVYNWRRALDWELQWQLIRQGRATAEEFINLQCLVVMGVLLAILITWLTSAIWIRITGYALCCCLFNRDDFDKAMCVTTCGYSAGYCHKAGRWGQAWWRTSVYNTCCMVRHPSAAKSFVMMEEEREERIRKRRDIAYEDASGIDSYLDTALAMTRQNPPEATMAEGLYQALAEYHLYLFYKLYLKCTYWKNCRRYCVCCDCCMKCSCCQEPPP